MDATDRDLAEVAYVRVCPGLIPLFLAVASSRLQLLGVRSSVGFCGWSALGCGREAAWCSPFVGSWRSPRDPCCRLPRVCVGRVPRSRSTPRSPPSLSSRCPVRSVPPRPRCRRPAAPDPRPSARTPLAPLPLPAASLGLAAPVPSHPSPRAPPRASHASRCLASAPLAHPRPPPPPRHRTPADSTPPPRPPPSPPPPPPPSLTP